MALIFEAAWGPVRWLSYLLAALGVLQEQPGCYLIPSPELLEGVL